MSRDALDFMPKFYILHKQIRGKSMKYYQRLRAIQEDSHKIRRKIRKKAKKHLKSKRNCAILIEAVHSASGPPRRTTKKAHLFSAPPAPRNQKSASLLRSPRAAQPKKRIFFVEEYRSGHNGPDSKSGSPQGLVGSNPTSSAIRE